MTDAPATHRAALPFSAPSDVLQGVVVRAETTSVHVRTDGGGERAARNAVAGDWKPMAGDRVLLLADGHGQCFVVGVLSALRPAPTEARPVTREDGTTRIAVTGDLVLAAPEGRVRIEAARGVEVESARDVRVRSSRAVRLESHDGEATRSSLTLEGDAAELRAGVFAAKAARLVAIAEEVTGLATRLDARVDEVRTRAERIESEVGVLVERARESYREVEGLSQTRVGRLRLVAQGQLSWLAGRAKLKAKEVFAIDGESIHLG